MSQRLLILANKEETGLVRYVFPPAKFCVEIVDPYQLVYPRHYIIFFAKT